MAGVGIGSAAMSEYLDCCLCHRPVDMDLPEEALEQELCVRCWDERKYVQCRYCHRKVKVDAMPEPDDEVLCGICEDERNDARRDEAAEKRWEERTGR